MASSVIYLLGAYPVWSETFLRQDLSFLLAAGLPLCPVALFPGDAAADPRGPVVPCLASGGPGPRSPAGAHVSLHLPPRWQERWSLWSHRRLRAALTDFARTHAALHIHAEFADLPGLLAATVAWDLGVPYSLGVHARDVHQPKFCLPRLLGQARFVTACNEAARRAVLAACPELNQRLHLIPHGVDLKAWPFRREAYAPHGDLRLFWAGRFVEKKGIDTLLRALATLTRSGVPAAVYLAGSGPLEAWLRALAHDLGVDHCVEWLGVLPHERVRQTLRTIDCLVVPSCVGRDGDRDGIPNIVLEAMAVGVPVVGTTAGGLGEVLNAQTGWVFPPADAEALAGLLRTVSADLREVERRRLAARALVQERYDAERLASQRVALFRELLR